MEDNLLQLTLQLRNRKHADKKYAGFHGDHLIGYQIPKSIGLGEDLKAILAVKNWPAIGNLIGKYVGNGGLDGTSAAQIAGSLSDYSTLRQKFIDNQVKSKYDKMLHPPLTYLGDAFQYRTADGSFNSVLHPHLGQAGAPYAKTVPSKTPPLGALPDPADIFDKLMARKEGGRESKSGLSSMLVYHATIIIHDIFRTNDNDKNISDSSSYLDLSPLYGYTKEMQRAIRDDRYGLGLLKPDAFAEDRLLRQPPGVCIMLVMYNRYHNYAAKQLYRINENGRFSVPSKYKDPKLVSVARNFYPPGAGTLIGNKSFDEEFEQLCKDYDEAWKKYDAANPKPKPEVNKEEAGKQNEEERKQKDKEREECEAANSKLDSEIAESFNKHQTALENCLKNWGNVTAESRKKFEEGYDAAWKKLDDDLFNTARLITCGIYIQISVHDYLRALMGFHQFDTNFTLDPRTDFDQRKTTRGLGNQVTVEFNLLYRFHCAISSRDEEYTEKFFKNLGIDNPSNMSLQDYLAAKVKIDQAKAKAVKEGKVKQPWELTFGIPEGPDEYQRNKITNLFDDEKMIKALTSAMDTPISNFGPCNTPKCLKPVEIMGILQARKWEVGTLNDFREFFDMERHKTFASISKNTEIQNALRDLYEHPDKVELYPGIFCESDEFMGLDPGPSEASSALWTAIFSDAITLVRSDRFYTVDWNTNSLTSWGMNEVTPNNEICKSSVFHRLIQRAFPGWFQYDSIRFFHPFYTAEQNAKFAEAQGHGPDFTIATPSKPQKPVYLENLNQIACVLDNDKDIFIHPVLRHRNLLSASLGEVLKPDYQKSAYKAVLNNRQLGSEPALRRYLEDLMRSIITRESISMTNATFQIDVTRDFAIPVVTRYVADFLGFGHLLRTETNLRGSYSENEIYQHITNCQVFLAYNADETKMLKRAKAFSKSMAFLIDLTLHANIASARQWDITRALFGRKCDNPMTELGFTIAQRLLKWDRDANKAAAVLLLISLDFAYDSVISFTTVVNHLMCELYKAADLPQSPLSEKPSWLEVQQKAFSNDLQDQLWLEDFVQKKARSTVRLPVVRIATSKQSFVSGTHDTFDVEENQKVILDIHNATIEMDKEMEEERKKESENPTANKTENKNPVVRSDVLDSKPIAGIYTASQPAQFNKLALTCMVGFIARMKNARRGHDTQGRLKRVSLDWTAEGYSNYTAPRRMSWIRHQVKCLPPNDKDKKVFTDKVLRPSTDTYLTPSWDEMVPFPMTWKIRFDGFGESDYNLGSVPFGKLKSVRLPDDAPPWYQPQGLSHTGGSFANTQLRVEGDGKVVAESAPKAAEREPTLSTGCGV